MAVISDRGELQSAQDYFPFGMAMPGRSTDAKHRYGFNGKETDPETGIQDYGMRWYLPNIARFPSVDPITKQYPELTPYQFASNTPIAAIDIDGLESGIVTKPADQTTPVIKVEYSTVIEAKTITRTGCQVTYVTTMKVTIGEVSRTFIGYRGGMAMCTDGSGKHYDDGTPNKDIALRGTWGSLNADKVMYATLPTVIREKYDVKIGDLVIVVGPHKDGGELTTPMVAGESSVEHGSEVSISGANHYGWGKNASGAISLNKTGPDETYNCKYQYWNVLNTSETPDAGYDLGMTPPTKGVCRGKCVEPTIQNPTNLVTISCMYFFEQGMALMKAQNRDPLPCNASPPKEKPKATPQEKPKAKSNTTHKSNKGK
jgi:RHS repeat-associated protein